LKEAKKLVAYEKTLLEHNEAVQGANSVEAQRSA